MLMQVLLVWNMLFTLMSKVLSQSPSPVASRVPWNTQLEGGKDGRKEEGGGGREGGGKGGRKGKGRRYERKERESCQLRGQG